MKRKNLWKIRKIILNYKFNDKAYLYRTISNFLIKNKEFCEKVKSYDFVKGRIIYRLVNRERNRKLLEDVPYK